MKATGIVRRIDDLGRSVPGLPVLVSDTDHFVAVSGTRKKDYIDKKIDDDLDRIIQNKSKYKDDGRIVIPILTNGDPIGSITILPDKDHGINDTEIKAAELGAGFLARQMEN